MNKVYYCIASDPLYCYSHFQFKTFRRSDGLKSYVIVNLKDAFMIGIFKRDKSLF